MGASSIPSVFLLCPLLLLRRLFELGVLLREARLAWAEALRPALKVLTTVVGSTGSGILLKLSWEAWSKSRGREWWWVRAVEEEGDSWCATLDRWCWMVLLVYVVLSQPGSLKGVRQKINMISSRDQGWCKSPSWKMTHLPSVCSRVEGRSLQWRREAHVLCLDRGVGV